MKKLVRTTSTVTFNLCCLSIGARLALYVALASENKDPLSCLGDIARWIYIKEGSKSEVHIMMAAI